MKIKSILIPSIIVSSILGAVYDQNTTPQTQTDLPTLCSSISFPANSFGFSSSPFSCNSTPSPSPSPTPTPTPTSSSSSVSNSYLTIDSKDVNNNQVAKSEYQINYTKDILKEIIDKVNTKTIQAKEIISSDGKISQARIEVPKNTDNVTLKAIVEVGNSTNKESTTIQAEDKVQITLSNDGGFTSKVINRNIEAEVNVNANAEATTKIIVQKKVEVTMKSPKGSEISQANNGKVTSKVKVEADIGETNFKPIEVEMSAETIGNLITTANITNTNGEVLTFKLSLPANVTSGDMELIKNSDNSNIYSAIKLNFKTSTNFKITDKSRRAVIVGNDIGIVGTSSWQEFEEKQYFNGKRTITLLLGSANVIKDGQKEELTKGIEYELLPPLSGEISNIELTKIYTNSYLNIQKGWNLITTPIDKELNIKDNFKYALLSYKYSNSWIQNPKTIKQNEGVWIKYSEHVSENIKGDSYYPNFTNLNSGWNLIGVGRNTNFSELINFSEIWIYDSKLKTWIKNPSTIKRGYGFWAK